MDVEVESVDGGECSKSWMLVIVDERIKWL